MAPPARPSTRISSPLLFLFFSSTTSSVLHRLTPAAVIYCPFHSLILPNSLFLLPYLTPPSSLFFPYHPLPRSLFALYLNLMAPLFFPSSPPLIVCVLSSHSSCYHIVLIFFSPLSVILLSSSLSPELLDLSLPLSLHPPFLLFPASASPSFGFYRLTPSSAISCLLPPRILPPSSYLLPHLSIPRLLFLSTQVRCLHVPSFSPSSLSLFLF